MALAQGIAFATTCVECHCWRVLSCLLTFLHCCCAACESAKTYVCLFRFCIRWWSCEHKSLTNADQQFFRKRNTCSWTVLIGFDCIMWVENHHEYWQQNANTAVIWFVCLALFSESSASYLHLFSLLAHHFVFVWSHGQIGHKKEKARRPCIPNSKTTPQNLKQVFSIQGFSWAQTFSILQQAEEGHREGCQEGNQGLFKFLVFWIWSGRESFEDMYLCFQTDCLLNCDYEHGRVGFIICFGFCKDASQCQKGPGDFGHHSWHQPFAAGSKSEGGECPKI